MKETGELNILVVGVGGQGVILMSQLLGEIAVAEGLNVTGSEVLGMAVRGGSVMSTIRMGRQVYGPLVPMGKGDILVGMEPVEALRNVTYLSASGLVLLNTRKVVPFTVTQGDKEYPDLDTIIGKLKIIASRVVTIDAVAVAKEAGSPQAANSVMLGALLALDRLPLSIDTVKNALRAHFSPKLSPVNLKAFDLGYQRCRAA